MRARYPNDTDLSAGDQTASIGVGVLNAVGPDILPIAERLGSAGDCVAGELESPVLVSAHPRVCVDTKVRFALIRHGGVPRIGVAPPSSCGSQSIAGRRRTTCDLHSLR
jgi:hypothetical protein